MSKIFNLYFISAFFFLCLLPFSAAASDVKEDLATANKAFEDEQYVQAMELYESVYAQGYFTEIMLYRLAFMHENLKGYPHAIYYLKKASQEFGSATADAKIRQMMQKQGSTRVFTSDFWDTYFLFFNGYGFIFWIIFIAFGIAVCLELLIIRRERSALHMVGVITGWGIFLVIGFTLFHYNFLSPNRAVITEKTSFYDFPSYGGNSMDRVFSLGETVDIVDSEDIWVKVEAGGRARWVPRHVIREL